MAIVVNFKSYGSVQALDRAFGKGNWMYIGRAMPMYGLNGSVLGNPFKGERMAVIAQYKQWLLDKIRADDTKAVNALMIARDMKALVCWCAPLACHGNVIISDEIKAEAFFRLGVTLS